MTYLNLNRDLTKPFSDEELATLGLEQVDGNLVAFDLRDVPHSHPLPGMILGPAVVPKLLNLLQAAPHMYQMLGREYAMLQSIIDHLETVNQQVKKDTGQPWQFAVHLVNTFTEMQNLLLNCRRVAIVGAEQVAEEQRRGY